MSNKKVTLNVTEFRKLVEAAIDQTRKAGINSINHIYVSFEFGLIFQEEMAAKERWRR